MALLRRFGARAAAVAAGFGLLGVTAGFAETPAMLARAASAEPATFDVYFPVQHQHALDALIAAQSRPGSKTYRAYLTPQQFRDQFGPPASTVEAVAAQLRAAGLTVVSRSALGLHVTGSAGAVETALAVKLIHARFSGGGEALVADHPPALAGALAASGARIPQFTTVPPLRKHSLVLGSQPDNFISTLGAYYAADLRQAYDVPSLLAVNGQGVTIGILMSGDFLQSDMDLYFDSERLFDTTMRPVITSIPVNGGAPYSAGNSAETHLDIQQSAGIAPGAAISLYNMSDLNASTVIFGLTLIDEDNKADVVNMSFGGPETDYLAANNNGVDQTWLLQIQHALFQQGNAQGITFVASSGDHGAIPVALNCTGTVCVQQPTLTAQNPADDPNVTSVGGTNLVTAHSAKSNTSAYVSENANPDPLTGTNAGIWASGGGISIIFAKPSYQSLVTTPSATFRTVPDLALHMGGCQASFPGFAPCGVNRSSDILAIGGSRTVAIGTSAASPNIAGLFALKVKLSKTVANPTGRLGNENLDIYTRAKAQTGGKGTPFHHAKIIGSNGHYNVAAPYDAVIGNGTVDARQLLGATALAASDQLGTASNP